MRGARLRERRRHEPGARHACRAQQPFSHLQAHRPRHIAVDDHSCR